MIITPMRTEQYRTKGERLLAKVRQLIREGNVRRIIIKSENGTTLIQVPMTIGVVGALALPVLAALGALAALLTDCSIEVERQDRPEVSNEGRDVKMPVPHHPSAADLAAIPEDQRHEDEIC
jgi:hypothetical protein